MTRQQYIAELSQLLFYMTPWDKAKTLEQYSKLFEESENEAALFNELGSPMRLAVTLNRSYEPTPEPTGQEEAGEPCQEEAAEEAEAEVEEETEEAEEEPAEESAETVEEAAEPEVEEAEAEAEEDQEPVEAAEEVAAVTKSEVEEIAVAEEEAVEETAEAEAVEETEEEQPEEEPAVEEEVLEEAEPSVEEAVDEEPADPMPLEILDEPGKEKIFSEIYAAATDAHSAVVVEEPAAAKTVRKARYLFLIPYTILSVLIAIPVVAVLAFVNVVLFAGGISCLCACLYLVILQLPGAVGIGNQLIYVGLAIVALVATLALVALGVWFAHVATAGFPRFLLETARKYGYREVEVQ